MGLEELLFVFGDSLLSQILMIIIGILLLIVIYFGIKEIILFFQKKNSQSKTQQILEIKKKERAISRNKERVMNKLRKERVGINKKLSKLKKK